MNLLKINPLLVVLLALLVFLVMKPIPALAGACDPLGGDITLGKYIPEVQIQKTAGNVVTFMYIYQRPDCRDFFQFRWGVVGQNEDQMQFNGGSCTFDCKIPQALTIDPSKATAFKLESCQSNPLQPASCTPWGVLYYLPYGPDTCQDGFVWREAFAGDHVCVIPGTRQQAAADNAQAASRLNPPGSDTCAQGFVWREARPTDHVCVTVATRGQTTSDNNQAHTHLAVADSGIPHNVICSLRYPYSC